MARSEHRREDLQILQQIIESFKMVFGGNCQSRSLSFSQSRARSLKTLRFRVFLEFDVSFTLITFFLEICLVSRVWPFFVVKFL